MKWQSVSQEDGEQFLSDANDGHFISNAASTTGLGAQQRSSSRAHPSLGFAMEGGTIEGEEAPFHSSIPGKKTARGMQDRSGAISIMLFLLTASQYYCGASILREGEVTALVGLERGVSRPRSTEVEGDGHCELPAREDLGCQREPEAARLDPGAAGAVLAEDLGHWVGTPSCPPHHACSTCADACFACDPTAAPLKQNLHTCLPAHRAAERVHTATALGWKQAAQGIKAFTGGPLSVSVCPIHHFPPQRGSCPACNCTAVHAAFRGCTDTRGLAWSACTTRARSFSTASAMGAR